MFGLLSKVGRVVVTRTTTSSVVNNATFNNLYKYNTKLTSVQSSNALMMRYFSTSKQTRQQTPEEIKMEIDRQLAMKDAVADEFDVDQVRVEQDLGLEERDPSANELVEDELKSIVEDDDTIEDEAGTEWLLKDNISIDEKLEELTKKISEYYTPKKEVISIDIHKPTTSTVITKCHNLIKQSEVFLGSKDFDKAEPLLLGAQSYFLKNKDLFNQVKDSEVTSDQLQGYITSYLANIYQSKNQYDFAKQYYEECLPLLEKSNDKNFYGSTLLNYAELLSNSDNQPECIKSCQKAIDIFEKTNTTDERLSFALFNMSSYLSFQNKFQEALPYCKRAFDGLSRSLGRNNQVVHTVASNLSKLYQELKMSKEQFELDKLFADDAEGEVTFESTPEDLSHIDLKQLKQTWLKQGHQRQADIDGFHKSSTTSKKEFAQFFKQMQQKGINCGTESLELFSNELQSIEYAPDNIQQWEPKTYQLGASSDK